MATKRKVCYFVTSADPMEKENVWNTLSEPEFGAAAWGAFPVCHKSKEAAGK